jgi:hypothetical protein
MIVTKEHQEALVSNYVKEKHNADECIGFIDGLKAALDLVKNLTIPVVVKSFYCGAEHNGGSLCETQCLGCDGFDRECNN